MNQSNPIPLAQTAAELLSLTVVSEYDRLRDQYAVTYFAVVDPRFDGNPPHLLPISPWFATHAQATQCQAQMQPDFPACYIAEFKTYFSSEYEAGRLELLTQVIGVDQGEQPLLGEFWVRSFRVVQGGEDNPDQYAPISPCFPSKEQAQAFQALSRPHYSASKIISQDYPAQDVSECHELQQVLFNDPFTVTLQTDSFSPQAEYGSVLTMKRGLVAQQGDIVAVGTGHEPCRRLEFYTEGLAYFAVATSVMMDV